MKSRLTSTIGVFTLSALALAMDQAGASGGPPLPDSEVSPARRIDRQSFQGPPQSQPAPIGFRNIDGSDNNPDFPLRGSAGIELVRMAPVDYSDQVSAMAGLDRPSPREVSNRVSAQDQDRPNPRGATDFLWQWGQFLDHDIDLTDGVEPAEHVDIAVPQGDIWFDPQGTGTQTISFNRSVYAADSGTGGDNPRQQLNEITAWIDASNVYGSDSEREAALRTLDGTGRLKISAGDLLPYNVDGLPNAGGSSAALFLAGDVRANEQVGLTAMHTLFVREHNHQAARIAEREPGLDGDAIYQRARRIVGAEMQVITYQEYLPVLLGPNALRPYAGYRPGVDGSIRNLFSSASYRYGHSALSPILLRLDRDGREVAAGHLALRDAFFAPQRIADEGGIDPILRGLAAQVCQDIDPLVIDDVRNFLFGEPGEGGFDLVSLNIQRGRDHGLPSYNDARRALGLRPAADFADISPDPQVADRLRAAYGSVEQVDVWVGGLAEPHLPAALVGELIAAVLRLQFEALRDGDRYWYQNSFTGDELRRIEQTRLADVIRRNTGIGRELPRNVFVAGQ